MECELCGKEHKGEYASGRFCSQKCARSFSSKEKRLETNAKVSKTLKGRKLSEEHKSNIKKNHWKKKTLVEFEERVCVICNVTFSIDKNKIRKYCDECKSSNRKEIRKFNDENKKQKNEEKRNKLDFENLSNYWQKKRLLEENNHKCMQCEQGEIWQGKHLELELHHIDGNKKNKNKENCIILCLNCHSQTENYKAKNMKRNDHGRI